MQSLFILALFGILFSTVAVITTSLSTSAMQQKLIRIEQVEDMFQDVETAVKKGYLGDNVDFGSLSGMTLGNARRIDVSVPSGQISRQISNEAFLGPYISWKSEDLLVDPWGTNMFMAAYYDDITIYADTLSPTGTNEVVAPVAAFILYSAGPDRIFGVGSGVSASSYPTSGFGGFPNTFDDIRRFTPDNNVGGEDDIVHVFTTLETAQEMWSHTKEVFDKMVSAVADNYKQQYDLFTPIIQTQYYDVVEFYDASFNWIGDQTGSSLGYGVNCESTLIHAWKDDDCNVPGIAGGNLTGFAGFPVMYNGMTNNDNRDRDAMKALGIDFEFQRIPPDLIDEPLDLTLGSSSNGLNDRMDFEITDTGSANDWDIEYSRRLEGGDIISGL